MHDLESPSATEVVRRKPPRAAYALPTLFTAGNIFLGFLSILRSIQGAVQINHPLGAAENFSFAAKTIGLAMLLDGLDGRIARLTHTTSDFGREMDSLSDVISFGIAPAILAYTWGVQFVGDVNPSTFDHLTRAGKTIAFLFLLCGSARLARFNVQKNPLPKNPGRPNRKYFVGLPIPPSAALIAAVVYASDGMPLAGWLPSVAWLALIALLSFMMISTWRYYAFKDNAFLKPRSPLTLVVVGGLIILCFFWSQPVLLALASTYAASGLFLRVGGLLRRRRSRPGSPPGLPPMEQPVG